MGTEIFVYENVNYYAKVYEDYQSSSVLFHTDIERIFVKPPENNIWIVTNLTKESRPDLSRSICIFYSGIDEKTTNPENYGVGGAPIEIFPPDISFNPKNQMVEITTCRGIFNNNKVQIHVDRYHGDKIPKKTTVVGYAWYYDRTRNRINLILEPNQLK
jgi:hypothetical protein